MGWVFLHFCNPTLDMKIESTKQCHLFPNAKTPGEWWHFNFQFFLFVEPPPYNKEMVYENNSHIFEAVDDDALKVAEETYLSYTSLVRDLVGKCTSDIEKARALFRYLTEKQLHHQSWFLYYPEEGNKRGAPTQLLRGVEFGIETKALLFKRLCAYAGLHCEVVKGYSKSTEYLPGEEFVDTRYRNTWNAVFAAGGWRLVQCNWAMLNLHSKAERETRKFYQDHYFLTDPDKFIFEFFPINSEWQLMERSITIQEFEDLPLLRSTFFHFGLGIFQVFCMSACEEIK